MHTVLTVCAAFFVSAQNDIFINHKKQMIMKKNYQTPTIELFAVAVEQGFAASGNGVSLSIKGEDDFGGSSNGEDAWAN